MCVYIYIYIYVAGFGMCFFVIYQKLRYNTLQVVIWKLWYYSLYGTIFVQTRLYESLFIATTDCVKVDFSNIDCMEVVIVEWLLGYAQVTVWNIICSNQIIWKFNYCYYRLCQSRFFQYNVWKLLLWNGCYGMHKSLIIDQYFFHYMPIDQWHDPYFFL